MASVFELDFVCLFVCLFDCLSANIITRSYIGTAVERAVEDNITCIIYFLKYIFRIYYLMFSFQLPKDNCGVS